jgi:hypothetical protein
MIPETLGALLAFFGLVAPGIVYEGRRERRRPPLVESTLREAGRVALTSLVFTVVALLIVGWLAERWNRLPDVGEWLQGGKSYAVDNYESVAAFLLLELAVACLLAVLAEQVTGARIKGDITASSTWYEALDSDRPRGTVRTWLRVLTASGAQFKGALRWYAPGAAEERDLVIGGNGLAILPLGADPENDDDWIPLPAWNQVIIPGDEIKHVLVTYLPQSGPPLRFGERLSSSQRLVAWARELKS